MTSKKGMLFPPHAASISFSSSTLNLFLPVVSASRCRATRNRFLAPLADIPAPLTLLEKFCKGNLAICVFKIQRFNFNT